MYKMNREEKVYFEIECNGRVSQSWASKLLLVQAHSR